MRKIILIGLVILLSGCKTFTAQGLVNNNEKYYKSGYTQGFYEGRMYQSIKALKGFIKKMEEDN